MYKYRMYRRYENKYKDGRSCKSFNILTIKKIWMTISVNLTLIISISHQGLALDFRHNCINKSQYFYYRIQFEINNILKYALNEHDEGNIVCKMWKLVKQDDLPEAAHKKHKLSME